VTDAIKKDWIYEFQPPEGHVHQGNTGISAKFQRYQRMEVDFERGVKGFFRRTLMEGPRIPDKKMDGPLKILAGGDNACMSS